MKKLKIFPIFLAVWPYICAVLLWFLNDISEQFQGIIMKTCIVMTIAIYLFNVVLACAYKAEGDDYHLAFWDMVTKLIHIPFYIGIFVIGLIFLVLTVVPVFIMVSPFVIIMLVIIDFFLMLTSSSYGINAVIRAKRKGKVLTLFTVVNIILHLFFVTDIISAIVVYVKLRKNKKIDEQKKYEQI